MEKEYKKHFSGALLGLLLFIPPIILYFIIKWDPSFYNNEGEEINLAIYLLIVIYWIAFYQIYKYRKRSKDRTWQLAQFLSDKWTIEKREEERIKLTSNFIFMSELKQEYPEIFEDELLKLPFNK